MINPDDYRPRIINGRRVASPEYRAWQQLKNRCNNPKGQDYAYYGGRGITYDPRWEEFDTFLADMGPRPEGMTLEREDFDQGYTPKNCCWADRTTQARNRRFIKRYKGKTTWEWADLLGIKHMTFHHRLWRFNNGQISEAQLFAKNTRG